MATKTVFITTTGAGTFTVPADLATPWSLEVIGGGGSSQPTATPGPGGVTGNAGGGAAYAKITSSDATLVPSQTLYVNVAVGGPSNSSTNGGVTWANVSSNASPTTTAQGVLADGGKTTGGPGLASASIGSTKYDGGAGGSGGGKAGAGGGGAGGPNGPGGPGGSAISGTDDTRGGSGGGGSGGGGSGTGGFSGHASAGSTGGIGGNNSAGVGASAGEVAGVDADPGSDGGAPGGGGHAQGGSGDGWDGSAGIDWTQTVGGSQAGPGSGASSAGAASVTYSFPGHTGGLYGGGGSSANNLQTGQQGGGAQGIIVLTYTAGHQQSAQATTTPTKSLVTNHGFRSALAASLSTVASVAHGVAHRMQGSSTPVSTMVRALTRSTLQAVPSYVASLTKRLPHSYQATTGSNVASLIRSTGKIIGARTNFIRNNAMSGAVAGAPGTLPTFWGGSSSPTAGISRSIALPTVNGIPYIDLTFAGTASSTFTFFVNLEGGSTIPAWQAQTWTLAVTMALAAGALNGASVGLGFAAENSSGTGLGSDPNVTGLAVTGSLQPFSLTSALSAFPSAAYTIPYARFSFTSGQTYNFTIRLGQMQFEPEAQVNLPITQTSSGFVTVYGATTSPLTSMVRAMAHAAPATVTPVSSLVRALSKSLVSRTNYISNGDAAGAVAGTPGTWPTGWSLSPAAGLTESIVGSGTSGGIPYVDIRLFGTPTAATSFLFITGSNVTVNPSYPYNLSAYLALAGGSLANVTSVLLQSDSFTSGGSYVNTPCQAVVSLTSTFTRSSSGGTTGATAAKADSFVSITTSTGVAVDLTIRMGGIQLSNQLWPYISTSGTPVTTPGGVVAPVASLAKQFVKFVSSLQAVSNPVSSLVKSTAKRVGGRTNSIRNSTATNGATVGTVGSGGALPTNWLSQFNPSALSVQVIGTGTESGLPYIDIRFFGTFAAAATYFLGFDNAYIIPAGNGQTWALSLYIRQVAGSLAHINSVNLVVDENGTSGAPISEHDGPDFSASLGAADIGSNRQPYIVTFTAGATVRAVDAELRLASTAGGAVDITLRIAQPQLEGLEVTPPIATTSGAVTVWGASTAAVASFLHGIGKVAIAPTTPVSTMVWTMARRLAAVTNPVASLVRMGLKPLQAITTPAAALRRATSVRVGARTNLMAWSHTFANWQSPAGGSVADNVITASDGTLTAGSFTESALTETHQTSNAVTFTPNSVNTFSMDFMPGSRTQVHLGFSSTYVAGGAGVFFNLTGTGSVAGATGGATGTIEQLTGGWYRVHATCTSTTGVSSANFFAQPSVALNIGYAGNGSLSFYMGRAMMTPKATPDPYVPTVGTAPLTVYGSSVAAPATLTKAELHGLLQAVTTPVASLTKLFAAGFREALVIISRSIKSW